MNYSKKKKRGREIFEFLGKKKPPQGIKKRLNTDSKVLLTPGT